MRKDVDILNSLRVYEANNKLPKKGNDMSISPDYTPFLGYLYSKLLEFTEKTVKQIKNTITYNENQDVLNEIDLLPIAYLYYRFPFFEYLYRFYFPFQSYQDYSGNNESFTEDMEASEEKEGQFNNVYPDGLATASAFFSNLEKVTVEDLDVYVKSYATFKKFDLETINYLIDDYKDNNIDFTWLSEIVANCKKPVDKDAFDNPFVLPAYLYYRNNWVFDYIQGCAYNKSNEYMDKAKKEAEKTNRSLDEIFKRNNALSEENQRLLAKLNESDLEQRYKYNSLIEAFNPSKVTLIIVPKNSNSLEQPNVDKGLEEAKSIRITYDGIDDIDEKDLSCFANVKGHYMNAKERILLLQIAFYGKNKETNKAKLDQLLEDATPTTVSHLNSMCKALFGVKMSKFFLDKNKKKINFIIKTPNTKEKD